MTSKSRKSMSHSWKYQSLEDHI